MASPTHRQLNYLRRLAEATGTTFTPPATRADASHEIRRLKHRPLEARSEVARERRAVSHEMARRGGSAAVRGDEVEGYGSSARWTGRRG